MDTPSEQISEPMPLLGLRLEVWKHSIQVTQHFTELSHKTRQMGLTGAVGGIALALTLLTQFPEARISMPWGGYDIEAHVAGLIMILVAVAIWMTKYLDVNLHHRMLRGSVEFTESIECTPAFQSLLGTKYGLAQSISRHSRSKTRTTDAAEVKRTSAERKLRKFYNRLIWANIFFGALILGTTFAYVKHDMIRINQTIVMPKK